MKKSNFPLFIPNACNYNQRCNKRTLVGQRDILLSFNLGDRFNGLGLKKETAIQFLLFNFHIYIYIYFNIVNNFTINELKLISQFVPYVTEKTIDTACTRSFIL